MPRALHTALLVRRITAVFRQFVAQSYCKSGQTVETATLRGSTAMAAHAAADPESDDGPMVDPDRRRAAPGVARRLATASWKRPTPTGQQGRQSAATALR